MNLEKACDTIEELSNLLKGKLQSLTTVELVIFIEIVQKFEEKQR
jgi:hypothetical protein